MWAITTISRVPSSCWLTTSERIASSAGERAGVPDDVRVADPQPERVLDVDRASMHVRIASPVSGAAVSAERSNASTKRSFCSRICSNSPLDRASMRRPPRPRASGAGRDAASAAPIAIDDLADRQLAVVALQASRAMRHIVRSGRGPGGVEVAEAHVTEALDARDPHQVVRAPRPPR